MVPTPVVRNKAGETHNKQSSMRERKAAALKAQVPSLIFGRASTLPCRRDCAVDPTAMQLNSPIQRFINKPSIKISTWDCLIWKGLKIPANLLSISTPALVAPSAQRGDAFRPALMWWPEATACCASCNPSQIPKSWQTWGRRTEQSILRDGSLRLIISRVYTGGVKFPWGQRRRWCWAGWGEIKQGWHAMLFILSK